MARPQAQHGAHAGIELVAVDGLGEEVVGVGGEALVAHFLFVGGRHHQDRHGVGGVELAHRFDEFDAVDVRHHVIDDEQVGLVVAAPLQPFERRRERDDLRVGRGEFADEGLDQGEVERRVIDDGNGHGGSWGAGSENCQRQIIGPSGSKLSRRSMFGSVPGAWLSPGLAGAVRGSVSTKRLPAPGVLKTLMFPPRMQVTRL